MGGGGDTNHHRIIVLPCSNIPPFDRVDSLLLTGQYTHHLYWENIPRTRSDVFSFTGNLQYWGGQQIFDIWIFVEPMPAVAKILRRWDLSANCLPQIHLILTVKVHSHGNDCEIIALNGRLDLNAGPPTHLNFLKSPLEKLQYNFLKLRFCCIKK
jgi:hypothetical protein